jgi:serine/threonine protein phosphatase PrpC
MTNTLKIPSNQNPAALQSQQASAMQSNLNNINASNQSMKNSFPMPPNNSIAQSNNHNQSIKPISGTMKLPGNNSTHFNPSIKNQSALNRPPNAQMSNIPNTNPIQSAMINQQHPNLALNRQNMQSVQSNLPQNSIHNPSQIPNVSMKNSLTPQQQQSMMQSQKLSKMSQNPNMSVHNSKMNNSSLRKSDIKASRNKSPPLVVSTKDGQKVSTQSDSHGNPYSTTEDIHQSMKIQQKNSNDKMDEVKDINDKKITGTGFRFYGSVSKAGRNQNGDTKQNQDTPLVHPNVGDVKGFNMFGVLDGHGPQGHFVSQFCKNYFIRRMNSFVIQCKQENITTPEGLYEKLKRTKFAFIIQAFKDADLEMTKQNQFEYNFSGTTCNIVFQFKKNLICASVGDSRGILIYDNDNNTNQGIFPLSHDHKPDLPQEMNRIMNNGGRVDKLTDQYGNKVGPNRVFKYGLTYPGLAMSRSLGDFEAKECGVITEPEIIEYKMNHNSKYMVICSDGVWEFLKNENVRDLGNVYYQKGDVGNFCTNLLKKAVETWEQCDIIRDDITIVCVYF